MFALLKRKTMKITLSKTEHQKLVCELYTDIEFPIPDLPNCKILVDEDPFITDISELLPKDIFIQLCNDAYDIWEATSFAPSLGEGLE
jgi:hypothetical protein